MTTHTDSAKQDGSHDRHSAPQARHPVPPPHPDPNLVVVTLNQEPVTIRRGQYTGEELKAALAVPVDHELDLVEDGDFKPIANEDKHHVRGGEVFISDVGQGQSSWPRRNRSCAACSRAASRPLW
jgi:hypothetical protein